MGRLALRVAGSYPHRTLLNLPRSTANMVLFIACSRGSIATTRHDTNPRHARIRLAAREGGSVELLIVSQTKYLIGGTPP